MNDRAFQSWEALFLSDTPLRRVIVTGGNGAGKTKTSRDLSQRLGLTVLHNDAFWLLNNWRKRPADQAARLRSAACASDRWILEGGPSVLCDPILARADLVVWLDVPVGLRMWRIFRRSLCYLGRSRPEHPEGNPEWPGPRQWRFLQQAWRRKSRDQALISAALHRADVPVLYLRKSSVPMTT